MKITVLGAGPAGLYAALLLKKTHPAYEIAIYERNPVDVTYGWGVVFSDRTLSSFQQADYKTYEQISSQFVIWDAIDVYYREERLRCGGHVIASISRKLLLRILSCRCQELGIPIYFDSEIQDLAGVGDYDLLIVADGVNSHIRRTYAQHFQPKVEMGKARYIWLGTPKVLDSFTFIFRENAHGLFQVHAYPFSGTTSTFIVECSETTWLKAGLDQMSEAESLTYCEQLFANDLNGAPLLSNNSKWVSFPTLTTRNWHYQRMVLLGDAAHTAHFSIGSGTKLAMEDAITLVNMLERYSDLDSALKQYELERRPVIELFQKAARESQAYFETIKQYLNLEPLPFTFQLLTRSGRITYNDLKLRDPRFGDRVDRWWVEKTTESATPHIVAPPPMLAPLQLRSLPLDNRIAFALPPSSPVTNGTPDEKLASQLYQAASAGANLLLTSITAVSADGRITPACPGLYYPEHARAWTTMVRTIHEHTMTKIALRLGHAGRRGSTRPRTEATDQPLRKGNWPLLSASSIPYASHSQVPTAMERSDMDRVREEFVRATLMAQEANFDLLQLYFAHGYLLASFLSPLSNQRNDEYGGSLENRLRYPLEVFDAVRAHWPSNKPLSIALTIDDCARGGTTPEEALTFVALLKQHGCDLLEVLAGQTVTASELAYSRGFLTSLSSLVRNRASIPTLVGGYLVSSDEVNTILAAGRADLCIMEMSS